jgi:hypothetical protein
MFVAPKLEKCLMSSISSLPPKSSDSVQQQAQSVKKTGYIPPHLRKKFEEVQKKAPVDLSSTTAFPSLCSSSVKESPIAPSSNTISFKSKIDSLIEFEKLSAIEKQKRLNATRAMDGFVILSLNLTPEVREEMFQQRIAQEKLAVQYQIDKDCGIEGIISLENIQLNEPQMLPLKRSLSQLYNQEEMDEDEMEVSYSEEEEIDE